MSDFTIDVGFNTNDLKKATEGMGVGGGQGTSGQAVSGGLNLNNLINAIKAALTATGILAILMNLKVILEFIGFVLGAISSLVGLLAVKFFEWSQSYFDDIEKGNLQLAIKINNGILAGVEWLANALISVLTFGQAGLGTDSQLELGRFQEEIILESFENFRNVRDQLNDGAASVEDLNKAQKDFNQSWFDSFLTEGEFEQIKSLKEANNTSFKEVLTLIDSSGVDVATAIEVGSSQVISNTDSAFTALNNALNYMEQQAEKIQAASRYEEKTKDIVFVGNQKKSLFDRALDFVTGS